MYPWSRHLYGATGFMKWGLTNTTVAAMILRDLVCGQENAWADTFNSLRRSTVWSIPKVMGEQLRGRH